MSGKTKHPKRPTRTVAMVQLGKHVWLIDLLFQEIPPFQSLSKEFTGESMGEKSKRSIVLGIYKMLMFFSTQNLFGFLTSPHCLSLEPPACSIQTNKYRVSLLIKSGQLHLHPSYNVSNLSEIDEIEVSRSQQWLRLMNE